jgi:hypothetical protein
MDGTVLDCLDVIESPKEGGSNFCDITVEEIIKNKPDLSFILGRSCVGKSTLAKQLADKGFNIIHLDELIKDIGLVNHIKEIYANSASEEISNKFMQAVKSKIKYPTVIEGAIKTISLIEKISKLSSAEQYAESLYIVYISPEKGETVERNMIERFKLQLEGRTDNPLPIQMSPELIEDFKKNGMDGSLVKAEMKRFAAETLDISSHRKELFANTSGGNKIYTLSSESISPSADSPSKLVEHQGGEEEKKGAGSPSAGSPRKLVEPEGDLEKKGAGCGCGIEIHEVSGIGQITDVLSMVERDSSNQVTLDPYGSRRWKLNEVSEKLPSPEGEFDLRSVVEEAPTNVKIMNLVEMVEDSKTNNPEDGEILFALESPKKKVKFADKELSQGPHYQEKKKEKKEKKAKKQQSTKVTIGGLEYDATGYGVYEIQQRRFRAQHDGGFDPLDLYEGQSYTDGGDIALKMIKRSKINELVNKVIGGLGDTISEFERSMSGGNGFDDYIVLAITAKEVKQSDIDDLDYLKSSLSNLAGEVDQALPKLDDQSRILLIGGKKMKRLKISKSDECRKKILELEKKTEPIIRKLEKKITEDINFIENITLLLKSKIKHINKVNGGLQPQFEESGNVEG